MRESDYNLLKKKKKQQKTKNKKKKQKKKKKKNMHIPYIMMIRLNKGYGCLATLLISPMSLKDRVS